MQERVSKALLYGDLTIHAEFMGCALAILSHMAPRGIAVPLTRTQSSSKSFLFHFSSWRLQVLEAFQLRCLRLNLYYIWSSIENDATGSLPRTRFREKLEIEFILLMLPRSVLEKI
jgi:hypothetical protein